MKDPDKIKVLIFGKNGQVGSSLIELFSKETVFDVSAYSSTEVDFSDLTALLAFLNNLSQIPDFIINAAAYTNVDKAEEERELADLINHKAVAIIANYCAKNNIGLIHYSTDYVFDGSGDKSFEENNTKNLHPLNHYGKTKLDAEKAIMNSRCKYIILRISWVYSDSGHNFANTIKKLCQQKEVITVVDDQFGSPTSATFVAFNTIKIIKKLSEKYADFPSGIYHLNNGQFTSWYNFAIQILHDLKKTNSALTTKIIPIKTSEYKTAAKRPLNSRLGCKKIKDIFKLEINS